MPQSEPSMTTKESLAQTGFNVGDKVVCIDDAYQRLDMAETPDGPLISGQTYCVIGESECGGLLLVGKRAISLRSGKQIGFDPSRFLPLNQFRLKFPKGFVPNPDNHFDFGYLREEESKFQKKIIFPEIEGLEDPRPIVQSAIEKLELVSDKFHDDEERESCLPSGHWSDESPEHIQKELRELLNSSQLAAHLNQQRIFWQFLMRRCKPTILFFRERSPLANVLFLMTLTGSTFRKEFVDGNLEDNDFLILTCGAGRLAAAPIRICDASEPDTFLRVLFEARHSFDYVMCDWSLAGDELAAAYRMTQDSPIVFLFPD